MTRSTKFLGMLMIIFFVVAGIWGIMKMQTNYGETDPDTVIENITDDVRMQYCDENIYDSIFLDQSDCSLAELEQKSELVVEVSVEEGRKMEFASTLSPVTVKQIIFAKNDAVKVGDIIYIEEPATIVEDVFSTYGYQLMKHGQNYILFLQHLPCIEGYKYSEKESKTYTLVSEYFGKYCTSKKENMALYQENDEEEISYKKVSSYAIYTCNKEILNTYINLWAKIQDEYNLGR